MRRTRLNVVPPMSKANSGKGTALAEINGHELVSLSNNSVPANIYVDSQILESKQDLNAPKESKTQRVKRLQEEAKNLAREQITEFEQALIMLAQMAEDIAEGGDMYQIGAREVCRRLSEELPRSLQTLQAIIKKS